VAAFMDKIGMQAVEGQLANLPRHPSQLYEALFEGLVLFAIIWLLHRRKPFDGFTGGLYALGYGVFRFIIEYFREPDADIGYRFSVDGAQIYENTSLLNISTGQILCSLMILGGIGILITCCVLDKRKKRKAEQGD
jgi:phosphatidylglycerol:prolipoprotein diacylglycerol transferase